VNNIPPKNFRRPYPLPFKNGLEDSLDLSTVGLGTYLGAPNDEDDFDTYITAKHLLMSKTVNVIDTAINYRCMKAERILGQVLNTVINQEKTINRDEVFISTKAGYMPDDGDNGIPASVLIEELFEKELITTEDIAGGIHCMHPSFLEH
jgi:aryl-alcohol dehydrogenase-like predicted oxidoreductase